LKGSQRGNKLGGLTVRLSHFLSFEGGTSMRWRVFMAQAKFKGVKLGGGGGLSSGSFGGASSTGGF